MGPVARRTAMSDPGTVRARGHDDDANISPELPEETRSHPRSGGLDPAAANDEVGRPRVAKEGGTAGPGAAPVLVPSVSTVSNQHSHRRRRRIIVTQYRPVPPQVDLP